MAVEWRETIYGPFPRRFRVDSLSELCDSQRGIQTGPFGSQLHSKDYVSSGTPIATVEHLGENRIIHQNLPLVSDHDRDRLSKYILRRGDILFSRVGSVDRRGLVRETEEGWLFSGRCLRVRPNVEIIDPVYLSYFFGLWAFKEHIRSIAVGATMPSLNTELLGNVPIVYPPLSEQRAIAKVLGALDDKIEMNLRINETLEEIARTLFKSWFVDFDPVRAKVDGRWRLGESLPGLPAELYGHVPERLVDSQVGFIPEGWRVELLGERIVSQLRKAEDPLQAPDTLFAHYSIPAFDRGELPVMEWGSGIRSRKTRLQPNVVLVSKLNPDIERVWLADVAIGDRAICSTEFLVFSPRPPFTVSYVYCLAKSSPFRAQMASLVTGTSKSHQRAPVSDVLSLEEIVPPATLIDFFDKQSASLLKKTRRNLREVSTLAGIRDILLPKLVSGRIHGNWRTGADANQPQEDSYVKP